MVVQDVQMPQAALEAQQDPEYIQARAEFAEWATHTKPEFVLLVTARNETPNLWCTYDGNYVHSFDSLKEGQAFIRRQNRSEPGMFPRGSYQFLFGNWSYNSKQALYELLQAAAQAYL